ncbi:hypothetical protein [Chroococcidiopsis sp. CCNUC1]|uniref:hypothetical protein n=1 Tax=Chroococcidiopsis sp. CCNUC1 TaxID=2653189 RepID=UPI0020203365|nr:hypothetical protein [Chroococcidiopsis sp. CCNUC1]URD53119.1 hypothetical protein M5J74_14215 [Chroococcidiopsis sp. CCNUC1]
MKFIGKNAKIIYRRSTDLLSHLVLCGVGQVLLKNQTVKLIVFDAENEAIAQWIPS